MLSTPVPTNIQQSFQWMRKSRLSKQRAYRKNTRALTSIRTAVVCMGEKPKASMNLAYKPKVEPQRTPAPRTKNKPFCFCKECLHLKNRYAKKPAGPVYCVFATKEIILQPA